VYIIAGYQNGYSFVGLATERQQIQVETHCIASVTKQYNCITWYQPQNCYALWPSR